MKPTRSWAIDGVSRHGLVGGLRRSKRMRGSVYRRRPGFEALLKATDVGRRQSDSSVLSGRSTRYRVGCSVDDAACHWHAVRVVGLEDEGDETAGPARRHRPQVGRLRNRTGPGLFSATSEEQLARSRPIEG